MNFASSIRAAEKKDKMERGCFEFICDAPTTFQGYGREHNRIELEGNVETHQLSNFQTLKLP